MIRRLWLFATLAAACAIPSSAQTVGSFQQWCQAGGQTSLTSGIASTTLIQASYPQCQVTVYITGTTTPATIYSTVSRAPLSNPFCANQDASFLFFAVLTLQYDVVLSNSNACNPPASYPQLPAPFMFTDVAVSGSGSGGGGGGGNVSNYLTPISGEVAIWVNATTIQGVPGLSSDPNGNLTANSFLARGSGAGITALTQGADSSSQCPVNSRCVEAPTSIPTSYTTVTAATGPTVQGIKVYSAMVSAKTAESFFPLPVLTGTANCFAYYAANGYQVSPQCYEQYVAGGSGSVQFGSGSTGGVWFVYPTVGLNYASGAVTLNGQYQFGASSGLYGVVITGLNGSSGILESGCSTFTQNTITRFLADGSICNSFLTDSGAILGYSGVNGIQSPSFSTIGSGVGLVGLAWNTLPGSAPGGVSQLAGDTSSQCLNVNNGNNGWNHLCGVGPQLALTGQTAAIGSTVWVSAAYAPAQYRVSAYLNENTCVGSSGSVALNLIYTDAHGVTTQTLATITLAASATNQAGPVYTFWVNSTSNISYSTTYSACGTSSSYDLHLTLERL